MSRSRFRTAGDSQACKLFIELGSPWQNTYLESFNGRVRDECLDVEEFGALVEAQTIIETWRT